MMAEELSAPPVLSTPAEHIFEDPTPVINPEDVPRWSEDDLHSTYEIDRTAREIREGGWTRVALQFPDVMLRDATWVIEALTRKLVQPELPGEHTENEHPNPTAQDSTETPHPTVRLYILADTSYSACCIDEIAAEHADAQVVVHYGRACLSPTSRLPVIYVFTQHRLDHDAAIRSFEQEFSDKDAKVVLMADITYQDHLVPVWTRLQSIGYRNLLSTAVVHDPAGTIPNRKLERTGAPDSDDAGPDLREYALFHISEPPSALLLALQSRMSSLHVLSTSKPSTMTDPTQTTTTLLRRRYARVLTLATAGVIGILVNTLSVSNYLANIDLIRRRIADAGKKSYTIVVGKLNASKLANFAEVDGWVVVGCWESGLVEDDAGFYRPVITPFELEAALMPDSERVWGVEWWGGMERLRLEDPGTDSAEVAGQVADQSQDTAYCEGGVDGEESAPPVFDLRTGRLVSHSQPMRVAVNGDPRGSSTQPPRTDSNALTKRAVGELATVNGVLSPGAEFLRSQRTWQGLGSDFAHEETSAVVEEGRSGVARGYTVGEAEDKS